MSTIQFRGARISTINFAGNESGIISRIHFRADLSRPVADRMGWAILAGDSETELISGLGKTFPLKGELSVASVKLTPNGLLKNQAIEFIGIDVKDFKVATKGGGSEPEDDPLETELRFTMTFPPDAAKRVLDYYLAVQGEPANLKVKIAKEQQMSLGEDVEESDDDADEKEEENASRAGGSLASVREIKVAVSER